MRVPRISIAGLMVFIMFLGVTFSAFHVGTEIWASALLTLSLASSGGALVGHLTAPTPDKAAWTGYLIFGTGYLALCIGPWCDVHIMPNLLTTPLIDKLYSRMQYTPTIVGERVWTAVPVGSGRDLVGGKIFGDVDAQTINFNVVYENGTTSRYNSTQLRSLSLNSYRRLCHSTISLWVGFLGTLFARYVVRRRYDSPISGAVSESTA